VPLFPKIDGTKIDPVTNVDSNYGQSFVCISLKSDATKIATEIYKALVQAKVYFYYDNTMYPRMLTGEESKEVTFLQRLNKALGQALDGNFSQAIKIATGFGHSGIPKGLQGLGPIVLPISGTPFTMIAKPSKLEVEVFSQFLIPGLEVAYSGLPLNFLSLIHI
jgi:hypothetical protein